MAIDLDPGNILQWVKEGRCFAATNADNADSNLSTPGDFETDLVVTTPDFVLRVPQGTVIVPFLVTVVTEATGAEVFQCLMRSCANDVGVANRTAGYSNNLNVRYAATSAKTSVLYTSTGACTTPTGTSDLYHAYVQADIDAVTESAAFEQVVYSPLHGRGVPCCIGSNSVENGLLVYVGNGTSADGYVNAYWAEWGFDEFYA